MTSVQFCYWLQGLYELADPISLNERQTDLIKKHLSMVFIHEIDNLVPENQKEVLNNIHNGKSYTPSQNDLPPSPFGGTSGKPRC